MPSCHDDNSLAHQILLTLPPEFLNVKAVREIVGIHEEIDTMEKAFMFYAAANPQDEAVWFAHNLEFKIRAAIHAVKARTYCLLLLCFYSRLRLCRYRV